MRMSEFETNPEILSNNELIDFIGKSGFFTPVQIEKVTELINEEPSIRQKIVEIFNITKKSELQAGIMLENLRDEVNALLE